MTALAKKPLCGSCQDGWLEAEDGTLTGRCPCRYETAMSGSAARDVGMAATVDANRDAMRAALAIIRDAAKANPVLSSNTVRHQMRLAQIPGPVVGAAFRQAAKDKVLRKIGYVPSLDGPTHAHPIAEWESLLFGRTA